MMVCASRRMVVVYTAAFIFVAFVWFAGKLSCESAFVLNRRQDRGDASGTEVTQKLPKHESANASETEVTRKLHKHDEWRDSCPSKPYTAEEVKAGRGRNIFLDCGACQGDTLEMFFHHGTIPGRVTLNPEFSIPFQYDPTTFQVHAFEANPQHTATLEKLAAQFPNLKVHKETALYHEMSMVELMVPTMYDVEGQPPNPHQGASLLDNHKDLKQGMKKVVVPSIDFSAWVRDNVGLNDFVMMKMNMEGAEYMVLSKMIQERTLYRISALWIWWHGYALPKSFPPDFEQSFHQTLREHQKCTRVYHG